MKLILLLFIVFTCNLLNGQIHEGRIDFKIEVTDKQKKSVDSMFQDLAFSISFTKEKAYVVERYSTIRETKFLYDKPLSEVLLLETIYDRKFFSYAKVSDHIIRPDPSSGRVEFEIDSLITKNILGYKCTRVVRDLGDVGRAILWVTDEIDPGVILPNSPLSMELPALEFTVFHGTSVVRYMATNVATTIADSSVFEERIPEEYGLSVPTGRYVPGMPFGDTARIDEVFDFVTYPFYPPGNDKWNDLFKNLPQELIAPHYLAYSAGLITFSVDMEGNIFNIDVPLTENERMKKAIIFILENNPTWTPATVRGKPVKANVSLQVMFP